MSLFPPKPPSKLAVQRIPNYREHSPLLISKASHSYHNHTVPGAHCPGSEGEHPASLIAACGAGHQETAAAGDYEGTNYGGGAGRTSQYSPPAFRPGIGGSGASGANHCCSPAGQRIGAEFGGTKFRPGIGGIDYRSRFKGPGKSSADRVDVTDHVEYVDIIITSYGLESGAMPDHEHAVRTSDHEAGICDSEKCVSAREPGHDTLCVPGCIGTEHESVCRGDADRGTAHRGTAHELGSGLSKLGGGVSVGEGKERNPCQLGDDSIEYGVKHVAMVPLRNKKQMQVTYTTREPPPRTHIITDGNESNVSVPQASSGPIHFVYEVKLNDEAADGADIGNDVTSEQSRCSYSCCCCCCCMGKKKKHRTGQHPGTEDTAKRVAIICYKTERLLKMVVPVSFLLLGVVIGLVILVVLSYQLTR